MIISELTGEPQANGLSRRRTAGLSWTWDDSSKPEIVAKLPFIRANLYFRIRAGETEGRRAILGICYWRKP